MEEKMETMQNSEEIREILWFENQVAFTFRSPLNPAEGKQRVIDELPLDQLNNFLGEQHKVTLRSFGPDDVPQGQSGNIAQHGGGLRDPLAKYLFPSPGDKGSVLVGFFHIDSADVSKDHTPEVVNNINQTRSIEGVQISAMPNWLGACTGDVGHGCPLTPPVSVDANDVCAASPGRWPITVSQLPAELQQINGAGVTVLVLDTAPKPTVIAEALSKVTQGTNGLLQDMATGMVEMETPFTPKLPDTNTATPPAISVYHQWLPGDDDPAGENQPKTGKDIDGNLIGYPMADHGLFVAGVIRTLAPAANIVCVRILNDFGVGNTTAIIQMLETIADHVQKEKVEKPDFHPRLIINMSMVVSPYDEQLQCLKLDGELSSSVREGLQAPLQVLANLGVIVVAAAGNDSDPRMGMKDSDLCTKIKDLDPPTGMKCMNMADGMRLGPRYPAAFADTIPQVIPVGAIDGSGQPAPYSDYPGTNGVATYGGGLLMRDVANSQPGHTLAMEPIDSLRGIYTTPYYPALSLCDTDTSQKEPVKFEYPEIDAPNNNACWAYWSGTSFATPIISGLTALVLQAKAPASDNVRQEVIAIAGANTVSWSGLNPVVSGPVIFVQRCATEMPSIQ